jgi:hypothetical protein
LIQWKSAGRMLSRSAASRTQAKLKGKRGFVESLERVE